MERVTEKDGACLAVCCQSSGLQSVLSGGEAKHAPIKEAGGLELESETEGIIHIRKTYFCHVRI